MNSAKSPKYKLYTHLGNAFTFEYPADWKHKVEDDNLTVVIFPEQNDEAAIRFETLPFSVDVQLFGDRLLTMLTQVLEMGQAREIAESKLLQYPSMCGLVGQISKSWVTAHDDLTIGITVSCVPEVEHDYQQIFEHVLTSFRIHREQQVQRQRLLMRVASKLHEACPGIDFKVSGDKIVSDRMELGVDNLASQILKQPGHTESAIDDFVASALEVIQTQKTLGQETWEQVKDQIFPMIRPARVAQILDDLANSSSNKLTPEEQAQRTLVASPWLADLAVCFAIDMPKSLRMINQSDLARWELDEEGLYEQAMKNLTKSELPALSVIANNQGQALLGGLGEGGLSAKSCYLLHPNLYAKAREALGNDIWVAIPNRDSLMMFAMSTMDRNTLLQAVKQDYESSNHQITDRIFLLTPDGAALG